MLRAFRREETTPGDDGGAHSLEPRRILFVGDLTPYLTTVARRDALLELGFPIESIDQNPYIRRGMFSALTYRTLLTPGVFALNREIAKRAERFRPDVAWLEKGTFIFPRTLRRLRRDPRLLLVYHNTDDWRLRGALHDLHWRFLRRTIGDYDLHITSNLWNVDEFRTAGFARVAHMELAANPAVRDPGNLPESERAALGGPVGFIGHWEPVTERRILHLVRHGVPTKVYGGGWDAAQARGELAGALQYRLVNGDEYARAIVSFDVNLGIVSKWNRNHTASRTFQIPALGGFLLHERNEVVTKYFKEGVEAEFFDTDDELLEKCRHYVAHVEERRRIAEAGRRRCVESGYFEPDRVREILPVLEKALRASREGRIGA
jgi:spore maturation protein CgeB